MANRRLSKTYLDYSISSQTSEESNYPASNIEIRTTPQRHWRSTATTEQDIVIDLGATQTSLTVYLDWVNFDTVQYAESSSSGGPWTTLQLSGSDNRTVEEDPVHGVYRRIDDLTLTTKRYLRIRIPAGSETGSDTYYRIGTFVICTSITELDTETWVEYPFEVSLPDSHVINTEFPGGKVETLQIGQLQPMVLSLRIQTESQTNIKGTKVSELSGFLRDPAQILLLDMNLGQSWQAWLCRAVGGMSVSLDSPNVNTADFSTVTFGVII